MLISHIVSTDLVQRERSAILFPEFELVTESEDFQEESDDEKSEEQKEAEYQQFLQKTKEKKGRTTNI